LIFLSYFKRHESKFKETVKEEYKAVKQDHRTMGFAKEPVPKPNEYLKAHEKQFTHQFPRPPVASNDFSSYKHDEVPKKPPVPSVNDKPLLGLKTNKNFVAQNAVDTIMTVPKKPEKNMVDTRKGDKFSLDPSGLTPVYVKKKVKL
jgi:hypothetical protein